MINKNKAFIVTLLVVVVVVLATYLLNMLAPHEVVNQSSETSEPSETVSASPSPLPTPRPSISKTPLPKASGISLFGEQTPWNLLLADASCELKGEIKFLNHNTYDNQDALFTYKGIDSSGRNIFWTITPQDGLSVGPNIFNKIPLPDGESLLGISLPENPKYKKYELTARIQYGRLVDEKGKFVTAGGNVKVFEKPCLGKTTVVLP
ncbi:MAG: hypothetical protein G01um101444_146 [Parcubacteria group bacterium Gr01-1014_44]|nr:MAG: hypothetical protein G01um101444_146 [Parcubacteria group bacterium Gr01-1014_44]